MSLGGYASHSPILMERSSTYATQASRAHHWYAMSGWAAARQAVADKHALLLGRLHHDNEDLVATLQEVVHREPETSNNDQPPAAC